MKFSASQNEEVVLGYDDLSSQSGVHKDMLKVGKDGVLRSFGGELVVGTDGKLSAAGLKTSTVVLTNAQILDLADTPAELVPAPGAGFWNEFVSAKIFYTYGGTVYTESADNMLVRYEDGAGPAASEAIESTGFVDASADTIMPVKAAASAALAAADVEDMPLTLNNEDGDFGGGDADSFWTITTVYRTYQVY